MKRAILMSLAGLTLVAACRDTLTLPTDSAVETSGRLAPRGPVLDDIRSDVVFDIDAAAKVMPLNVDGPDGTTVLSVVTANGDGKNGCNLTGSTTLVVSVASSNAGVASVSPSSVTFDSCGALPTLTVKPLAAGSTTISLAQTSNNSGGTFTLAQATFVVNVTPPPNTAPGLVVAGVTGGSSYNKGSVPAATCEVTDAEDGNSSFPATLSAITGPYSADGIGSQTASCSYTDDGGLLASASETYSIVDPTPPVITKTLTPATADGDNGWYKSSVTLDWTVSDPESPNSLLISGNIAGCADQNITADQQEQAYSCEATSAGGTSGPVEVKIKRDATAPTASLIDGPVNGGEYYFGSVPSAPTCSASDATSGLVSACTVAGYSTAVGSQTVSSSVQDKAGNQAAASNSYTVLAWTLRGFYSPVDMSSGTNVYNTVKGGSTVPLKFEAFAGDELTDVAIVKSFKTQKITCEAAALEDAIEIVSTGGTTLRYDQTGGQFIQNWQTPKAAGACYSATVTTQDGSSITAYFKLK
jgi:hypothetical protein